MTLSTDELRILIQVLAATGTKDLQSAEILIALQKKLKEMLEPKKATHET